MSKIDTLYTSYEEMILDLNLYGKIISTPTINRDELKKLLFEEFRKTHPVPSLENYRYSLSELVSSDFNIRYNEELKRETQETLQKYSKSKEYIDCDFELSDKYKIEQLNYPISPNNRNKLLDEIEELEVDYKEVEDVFDTYETNNEYIEEDDDEDYYEEEIEEIANEDTERGIYTEDTEYADDELEFVESTSDSVFEPPKAVITKIDKVEIKEEDTLEEDDTKKVPSNLIDFLRENPKCEYREALKYYTKKEIQTNLLVGKVIKKGNKLHLLH